MATVDAVKATSLWQVPRLDPQSRLVTGVASAIAVEIGIDAVYVRVGFVVLALAGGWGFVLYAVAWVLLNRAKPVDAYVPIAKARSRRERIVGFALIGFALVLLSSVFNLGFDNSFIVPVALVGSAVAIAWDRGAGDRVDLGQISASGNVVTRVVLGLACLFAGIIAALALSLSLSQALSGSIVAALVLLGAGIVFAPVIRSMGTDLLNERRERIRFEERADLAAHLHDSVLQTLTLIQKKSADSSVVSLARRQERELRSWLFDDQVLSPNLGFRSELVRRLDAVEGLHEVPIEVVVVGDTPVDGDIDALLNAVSEAATNAVKHSEADRVDVFAEVTATSVDVFVRDQGVGFDPDDIGDDRFGVRDSIRARMKRHGGSAHIASTLGSGTEVELMMPIANGSGSLANGSEPVGDSGVYQSGAYQIETIKPENNNVGKPIE